MKILLDVPAEPKQPELRLKLTQPGEDICIIATDEKGLTNVIGQFVVFDNKMELFRAPLTGNFLKLIRTTPSGRIDLSE